MTLQWGIAATGRIARAVGTVIAQHPTMAVAAVASRDLGRAQGLAADLGGRAYDSYQQLVDDPAVQAVYVATPHAQHAEVVEIALQAGKAVLCEKPLTHALAESERLAALSESTGTFLMEAMWMRFNPLVQQLLAQTRGGALGELRSVHASFGFAAPDEPSSRLWDPALGGGALLDLAVYTVDLARLVLGEPTGLTATGSLRNGVDAEETLHLSFAGGAHAQLDTSLVARLPGTALIVGSQGYAELAPTFHAPTRLTIERSGAAVEVHEIADRTAGFVGELEEVALALREGRRESRLNTLADTLGTLRVLEQARSLLPQ